MKLLQGDCLELMKQIPDGSIDMVLCDPPYGTTYNKWDTVIPFAPLWEQWLRVCKRNAAILVFSQQPFTSALVMSNPKMFRYEWIYEKTNATGFLNANKMPLKAHENICVFYRKLPTFNPQKVKGKPYSKPSSEQYSKNYGKFIRHFQMQSYDGRRYPRSIITISNPSWGPDKGDAPTQKPVALLEYLIKTYTNAGETVLDNTMGSGSTGVACVNTGRDFIGIEMDKHYFDIAEKRITEAQAQQKLPLAE